MASAAALLFDTSALIDIYRARPILQTHFQSVIAGELEGYLSVLSEAELWRGVKSAEVERHKATLSYLISLPLDSGAARLAGDWMRQHDVQGLGWMDALITATAVRAKLAVLTRDAKLARLLAGEAKFEVYAG